VCVSLTGDTGPIIGQPSASSCIDGKAGRIGIDRFGDVAKADGSKPATRTKHGFEDLRRRVWPRKTLLILFIGAWTVTV
jgi:hypothetical protein